MSSLSFVASAVQTGTADGGYEETPLESKEAEVVNRRNAHKPLFEQLRQNKEEEDMKREEIQRDIMRGTCTLDSDDVAHLDAVRQQQQERETQIRQQTNDELLQFRALKALRQQKEQEKVNSSATAKVGVGLGAINPSNDLDDVVVDETIGADHRGLGYIGGGSVVGQQQQKEQEQQKDGPSSASAVAGGGIIPKFKVKKRKRRTEATTTTATDDALADSTTKTHSVVATSAASIKKDRPAITSASAGSETVGGEQATVTEPEAKTTTNISTTTATAVNSLLAGYGSSSDEED